MWHLNGSEASLIHTKWRAHYCTAHPELGLSLTHEEAPDRRIVLSLIEPTDGSPRQASDAYVRQNDLICEFAQTANDQFSFQTYFRILPDSTENLLGLEVWLSVQTDLLDSSPSMELASIVPNGFWTTQSLSSSPGGDSIWLASSRDDRYTALSVAAMVHPLDAAQTMRDENPAISEDVLQLRYFSHFMEKGVIRRARMRFYLSRRVVFDVESISQLYEQFHQSELPLTT
ncbi:MAG: hypothetical protein J0M26_15520 [Planctomycetes bacterium]|nr:hypothetical protein [Planctomycetota bacterium]